MKVIYSLALFLKGRIPGRAKTSKNKMGGDIQEVILNISLEIILLHLWLGISKMTVPISLKLTFILSGN